MSCTLKLQPQLEVVSDEPHRLHDVLRHPVLWSPLCRDCSQSFTHTGWTSHIVYALQCGSCGFTAAAAAAAEPENSSAARWFHSEEAAYVMHVAEHCRASEKLMLRGATAIKGVWAIGKKPRGYWSNISTCWRRLAKPQHSRGIWFLCKVTFALEF